MHSRSVRQILRTAPTDDVVRASPHHWQRTVGNRGVGSLLSAWRVQRKLSIGQPGDAFEKEADDVADRVMRMPDPVVQRCDCGGACVDCSEGQKGVPVLQRVHAGAEPGTVAPPIVHDALRTPGEPLSESARAYLEPRFGQDLGHLRIHRDAPAAESARAVNALAYTVGRDIVFAAGRYQPNTEAGRRLLAHETAHTVQQEAFGPHLLQRTLSPETTPECGHVAGRSIRHVDVDQENPQHVSWEWDDGTTETARCSTGKGHCCVGPEAVTGAACTERGSRVGGSNCTAVGRHTVSSRIRRTAGGVEFWTEFVTGRSIALHKYWPVDGTPLSHGCVRLDEAPAIKIWCGSREGRTAVRVTGLARPRCDHRALQEEWLGDFREAGRRPADGERFDARTIRNIERTRRALRGALGVGEEELGRRVEALRGETHGFGTALSVSDLAAVARAIPRCVPTETVEEERLGAPATAPAAGGPRAFIAAAGFERFLAPLERDYRRSTDLASARRAVRVHGRALWGAATARARGATGDTDDRPLYWTRLAMARSIRDTTPTWLDRLAPDTHRRTLEGLLELFERASRGMDTAAFTERASIRRIVISGFDPFALTTDVRGSNPSGAAVLALDGWRPTAGSINGRVQGVVFPVRYPDFDAGTVERFFGPYLRGPYPADLIMTISMGISGVEELEEFAGRRRSTTFRENLGLTGGGTPSVPVAPPGLGPGAEFLRTTVSAGALAAMRASLGRSAPLPSETEVVVPGGPPAPRVAGSTAISGGLTAVEGAGGGFLSNEIFYRTLRLVTTHADPVPLIHLHTRRLEVSGSDAGDAAFVARRQQIVDAIRHVLLAALPVL